MKTIKSISVDMKVSVTLRNVKVTDEVYNALKGSLGEELSEYSGDETAIEWLNDNIDGNNSGECQYEINDIVV